MDVLPFCVRGARWINCWEWEHAENACAHVQTPVSLGCIHVCLFLTLYVRVFLPRRGLILCLAFHSCLHNTDIIRSPKSLLTPAPPSQTQKKDISLSTCTSTTCNTCSDSNRMWKVKLPCCQNVALIPNTQSSSRTTLLQLRSFEREVRNSHPKYESAASFFFFCDWNFSMIIICGFVLAGGLAEACGGVGKRSSPQWALSAAGFPVVAGRVWDMTKMTGLDGNSAPRSTHQTLTHSL